MKNTENEAKEYYIIDFAHILKTIWSKIWVVITSSILAALIGFIISAFIITPT